jgi:hypothetical protein
VVSSSSNFRALRQRQLWRPTESFWKNWNPIKASFNLDVVEIVITCDTF